MLVTLLGFVFIPVFIVSGAVKYFISDQTGGIFVFDLSLIF